MVLWSTYYNNLLIQFNMVNSITIGDHETSIFKNKKEITTGKWYRIPCKRIQNIQSLQYLFRKYHVAEKHRTVYASAARINWKKLTNDFQPMNPQEELKHWNDNFSEHVKGIDLVIDIDSPSLKKAWQVAQKISQDFPFKHSIIFSGKKGFHIRTQHELLPKNMTLKMMQNLAKELKEKYPEVDPSTVNPRQPIRIPYSLHETGLVCYPLDAEDISPDVKSIIRSARPENVLKKRLYDPEKYADRKGYNRGLPLFYGGEAID